jgi:hypothetical protein
VRLPRAGQSILDTREAAALRITAQVHAGRTAQVPSMGPALDDMPERPELRLMSWAIEAGARVEGALPAALPRLLDGQVLQVLAQAAAVPLALREVKLVLGER